MFGYAIAHIAAHMLAHTPATQPGDQPFSAMPTGTYRYRLDSNDRPSQTFLFRKSGSVVIGAELMSRTNVSALSCFRGQAEGDRIINITQVSPPYSPSSNWESGLSIEITTQAGAVSLEDYLPTASEQTSLETCIQLFWR